jgi:hypothetical protein
MRCKVTSAAARLVDGRESQSEASTSAAARSPDRMAPSMLPCDSVVVPLPPIVTSIVNCSPMPWRTSVSLYDNGTLGLGPGRPPRNVRYVIDTQAKTATFAGALTDSEVGSSGCCGSTRLLPGGNIVTGWGGTPQIAEYAPDGTRLFRISGTFVYRGTPILPGSFTAQQFRDGMDTQFAAGVTAQTAGPPANLANSPLAATLRSMQCCGTPR